MQVYHLRGILLGTNITELLINKIPHEKNLLEKSLSLLKKEMANRFQG
jgi:hypothetical protein